MLRQIVPVLFSMDIPATLAYFTSQIRATAVSKPL